MDDGRVLALGTIAAFSLPVGIATVAGMTLPIAGSLATDFAELDKTAAKKGKPVRAGDKVPFKIRWTPMDKAWKDRFDVVNTKRIEAMSDEQQIATARLVATLLAFGGDRVAVVGFDEDLPRLFARGQLWSGRGAAMMPGESSRCHSNAAFLWDSNRDNVLLATGYALSKDGMWRQHSFGIYVPYEGEQLRVVETTEPRVAYFGFVMSPRESERFYNENCI